MADEDRAGGPTTASGGGGPFAAAMAALGAADREEANAFLREQKALAREQAEVARLQAEDLRRDDSVRHWSVRVRHVSDVLKLTFQFALAGIALAILIGLGIAVWTAAHDSALVIDVFSVPPDLAARGLTGQAIAAQVQDKLTRMQALTDSARPAASYTNNWGDSIKVQIPDTGVSVGEFYRLLVLWFGHETHVSGEVFHTAKGLAITARVSGGEGQMVTSDNADVEALVKRAAEKIYEVTQPYRYANYLANNPGTYDAGLRRAKQLYAHGSRLDRLWATTMLATQARMSDPIHAPEISRAAIALAPGFALTYMNLGSSESALDHTEAALQAFEKIQTLLSQGNAGMSPPTRKISLAAMSAIVAEARGNFGEALRDNQNTMGLPDYSKEIFGAQIASMADLANLHLRKMARRALASPPAPPNALGKIYSSLSILETHAALGDWQAVLRDRSQIQANLAAILQTPPSTQRFADVTIKRSVWPFVAEALAYTGQFTTAHALIAKTPIDCDRCVRMRGRIAAIKHDWKSAAHWFAMVSARTPSIPFADTEWGRMLMAKGDFDAAITKFESAHKKGPHFGDPLEYWGEALIAKNRSDLALAKFEEAAKYAPKWGRLHLKWGEALLWTGDKQGAEKQFAIAAELYLTPIEKAQLRRVQGMAHQA